jgi:hypothetical protein
VALIDTQRAVLALCFRAQPPAEALHALGGGPQWLVYRELVRERLLRELKVALPRTAALCTPAVLDETFVWQLEHAPPRTRYFREVVRAFVEAALARWAEDPGLPPACRDMARYELALWDVSDLDARPDGALQEFAFDRVPVVSGALALLEVGHAVHLPECSPGTHYLCVHRQHDGERPRTFRLTRPTYELLRELCAGERSVSESVRQLAAAGGARIDAAYLDALCATLAQFIEVGIVLGSR